MRRHTPPFVLAALLASTVACDGSGGSGGSVPATTAQDGHATGRVVDTQGRPIVGARVHLDNTVFHSSHMQATTGEDGRYRLKMQPGAWQASAKFSRQYNGRTYELELHPENGDSFDDDGAVRNFSWKLEGRSPLNEYRYYGGFDGSEGKVLRLRFGGPRWVQYGHIEDIPIGRYRVTATLDSEAGPRPLRIQDRHAQGGFEREFVLDFIPESGVAARENSAAIVIGY